MQRSSARIRYRFDDREMDFALLYALGAATTGAPQSGELFDVASRITDGDTASWVRELEAYGDAQRALAAARLAGGHRRTASELLMKAYYGYRMAWQFTGRTEAFERLITRYEAAFADAIALSDLPITAIEVPYEGSSLPGFRLDAGPVAPTLLVVGGLDSCREEMYHLIGLSTWRRGWTTVVVDLPGQGSTPRRGLHLMKETERPIGAVIDHLVEAYGLDPARLALMGMSAGGYMVSRAVMTERRVAACVASTPIFDGGGILPPAAVAQLADLGAMKDAFWTYLWRSGTTTPAELAATIQTFRADPAPVTCPYLSIAGTGESPAFLAQAREWHARLTVGRKDLVELDAATGADAHCQVNNPVRLAQEVTDWLDEVLGAS